ncbi:peptidoglycan DD-metalloendopeptidase family protein [Streptomyces sp. TRM64462]|uniref:M23 family metallopeptidase n=1 Tax=Streptomyces sp. TRM64462 TaxID=2741726 RepID=UPI0015869CF2
MIPAAMPVFGTLRDMNGTILLLVTAALLATVTHATPHAHGTWQGTAVWPLGPPRPVIVRPWNPPATPYGPGHRGVDLAARPGTPVRAAADGVITFAGSVAGRGVLTITHPSPPGTPPLRTTYEPVNPTAPNGTAVRAGHIVATTSPAPASASHCAATCLHWGLRRGTTYLNPLSLLPPALLRRPPSRLLPVTPRMSAGLTPAH